MTATSNRRPPLDPECGAVWREVSDTVFAGGGMRIDAASLEEARTLSRIDRDALLAARPSFTERELRIPSATGDLALSVFESAPAATPGPAVLWIHGGGMVMGDRYSVLEALDIAEPVGAIVVSVDYRLAPEHPAPAPLDDCYTALLWVADHASEIGVDPARLVLAGVSAGGGLAAATALRARDNAGPSLAGLMLCCPMLDDRMDTVSVAQFEDGMLWTRTSNELGWRALLGDRFGTDDVTIYEAPGRAVDLSGLPPTLVDVGSADMFRDEDVAFASAIWASGGQGELHVWPGAYHGSELLVPDAALSFDAVAARRQWLTRTLAEPDG